MGRHRTYGTKRSTITSSTSAIFGRSPLSDITEAVSNLNIAGSRSESDNEVKTDNVDKSSDNSTSCPLAECIKPLVQSYFKDLKVPLQIQDWAAILDENSTLSKIAEASFAEVYRVTNDQGSSILKIIQLKVPSDLASLRSPTAVKVEATVSEVRIMTAMAEVPGFVKFKELYIVQGIPTKALANAYEQYIIPKRSSIFPHPKTYNEDSAFLVLELGDAGCVLDDISLENIDQVWDILLSTIMALGRAEESFQFEVSH